MVMVSDFKEQREWEAGPGLRGLLVHGQHFINASSDVPSNLRGSRRARGDDRKLREEEDPGY